MILRSVKRYHAALCVFFAAFFFASCATTIGIPVIRPPVVDVHGVKKISVIPLEYNYQQDVPLVSSAARHIPSVLFQILFASNIHSYNESQYNVSKEITAQLIENIKNTGVYTVITSLQLAGMQNSEYSTQIDMYITGDVTEYNVSDTLQEEKYIDEKGNEEKKYYWQREVRLSFRYQYIRAKDGEILYVSEHSTTSTSGDQRSSLTSAFDMARSIIKSETRSVTKEIVPWTSIEHRTLQKDRAKDPRMNEALKLVKQKKYESARGQYRAIYDDTKNFAAGYNEAVLCELLDGAENALVRMEALGNDYRFGSERGEIEKALNRLRKDSRDLRAAQSYRERE